MITPAEQSEFRLVIQHARIEGWLRQGDEITADELNGSIVVECRRANQVRTRRYPNDRRWPYQLLRDLAHGDWLALPAGEPAAAAIDEFHAETAVPA